MIHEIARHYDELAGVYLRFWGEHIHHGYWEGDEPPARAQVKLIEKLAWEAEIARGSRVLDLGCGYGGSALWLCRELGCSVLGITISRVQAEIARQLARRAGVEGQVSFLVADGERLPLSGGRFDCVWIIEASEHMADKRAFFSHSARMLKPGGKLALCAWLAADGLAESSRRAYIEPVRVGFLCPSIASNAEYCAWIEAAGLSIEKTLDLTDRVKKTWEICRRSARRPLARLLLATKYRSAASFVAAFEAIERAFASGAMRYRLIVAGKQGLE